MPDIDLDTRIRDLVARAVADAPARARARPRRRADERARPGQPPVVDRRRRGAVLAAAAIVAAFVARRRSGRRRRRPRRPRRHVTRPAPPDDDRRRRHRAVARRRPRRRRRRRARAVAAASIAVAGPDGVVDPRRRGDAIRTLRRADGDRPADVGDGRVIVAARQRRRSTRATTTPADLGARRFADRAVRPDVSWAGPVTLHDVANVDDVPTAAVQRRATDVEDARGRTRRRCTSTTLDGPNAGAPPASATSVGWESGTGRLHLVVERA